MSFSDDKELLQDFLVEAGEILEKLSEQLVELERSPTNIDLLNAIFRGFHTVKGGAGFLQIEPLVDCCHKTENLFDILRNQKRVVDAELMDVTLQALDAVNAMFAALQEGQEPEAAPASVLSALDALVSGPAPVSVASPKVAVPVPVATQAANTPVTKVEVSDTDFESFVTTLNTLPDTNEVAPAAVSQSRELTSDEISDDEFEALLDSLHGKGKPVSQTSQDEKSADAIKIIPVTESEVKNVNKSDDSITDDEFELLLDQLQNKKSVPVKSTPVAAPATMAPVMKKPVQTSAAPPVTRVEEKPKPVVQEHRKDDDEHKTSDDKGSAVVAENTVRVDTRRLDDIMNMVGELVLVRNRLVRLGATCSDEEISKTIANLDVVTGDLQTSVMKTRMQSIKKVFGRFPRVVRDLARSLHKEVTLVLVGEETDLDKNLVEALADPLVHLVRNAVDHGVEQPDVREAAGKPRQGTITLAAAQEGDHILLTITDDGAGMDVEKLRAKAIEKGLFTAEVANRLSDRECFELIFAPGFSTKSVVSDVSGRGVGMDVVKTKISQLNGLVQVDSQVGQGSCITIKVPLTLAIMPTLMVMLDTQVFAFPLASVSEIFNLDLRSTNVVDGQEVIIVREKTIPLFHLKRWLISGADNVISENSHVVVVSIGSKHVGFVVDQLIGQEEVVIKPLGKMLTGTPGVSGATITGDGGIALILDLSSMLEKYAVHDRHKSSELVREKLDKIHLQESHAA